VALPKYGLATPCTFSLLGVKYYAIFLEVDVTLVLHVISNYCRILGLV
jgi:hypothetical protein